MLKIPELVAAYDPYVKFQTDAKAPCFIYFLKKNSKVKNVDAMDILEKFLQDAIRILTGQDAKEDGAKL